MNKDFLKFQRVFTQYQKLFGLTGYKVYFKHEPIEGSYANLTSAHPCMTATARLNSEVPDTAKANINIHSNSKHEAIHLLLARLEDRAVNRWATHDEVTEAVEEIVYKLETLIPDLKENK